MSSSQPGKITTRSVLIAVAALAVVVLAAWFYRSEWKEWRVGELPSQSVSDGTLTFFYPPEFGLAVTRDQILVHSYIPPCDENFDYCFYYVGEAYEGTNFESAGIRVQKVAGVAKPAQCLAPPYDGLQRSSYEGADYATAVFTPFGQGAAGHYSIGALYRLAYKGSCYEFETRVGQSQFANYPLGAVRKFTDSDEQEIGNALAGFMKNIRFSATGEPVRFGR